jgi:hypothetical protein
VLSVIGLALDLVGAVALTIGLFRGPLPLYPGYVRSPEDAATDRAYGTVGGGFLVVGFALQALTYCGINLDSGSMANILAAVIALCLGALGATGLWGCAYIVHLRRVDAEARAQWPDFDTGGLRRERTGLRFWRHVREPPW